MYKILIIDDDAPLSRGYQDVFKREGWDASIAVNGQEGLKAVKQYKPDLIMVDMLMPVMGGVDFLKEYQKIKDTYPAKIIVATNSQEPDESEMVVKQLGALEYKRKTELGPRELVELIKKYLEPLPK